MFKEASLSTAACLAAAAVLVVAHPGVATAQEQQEGPGTRVVTVTTFDVPIHHRSTVLPFIVQQVAPSTQLNPHVINFRIMLHNWGGNAAQVVMVSEYADIADIEAECGQPCDDYYEANPAPEEGDEDYEDFQKAQELFQKYYSHHRDEIYSTPMGLAKVEGEMMVPVGGPEQEDEGGM